MRPKQTRPFDVRLFLDSADVEKQHLEYRRAEGIFSQGDVCNTVMYIHTGGVKLSVRSKPGREVVVAMLGPAPFLAKGAWQDSRAGWEARRPLP